MTPKIRNLRPRNSGKAFQLSVPSLLLLQALAGCESQNSSATDASFSDAAEDARFDVRIDSGPDAGFDAQPKNDAAMDAQGDAQADAQSDAQPDGGQDARSEVSAASEILREIEYRRLHGDPRLSTLLGHSDPAIVVAAIRAAANNRDASQTPTIETLLLNNSVLVRRAAAEALSWTSMIEGDRANILTALENRLTVETDDGVRARILMALRTADRESVFESIRFELEYKPMDSLSYRAALRAAYEHLTAERSATPRRETRVLSISLPLAERIYESVETADARTAAEASLVMFRLFGTASSSARMSQAFVDRITQGYPNLPTPEAQRFMSYCFFYLDNAASRSALESVVRSSTRTSTRSMALYILSQLTVDAASRQVFLDMLQSPLPQMVHTAAEWMTLAPAGTVANEGAALVSAYDTQTSAWAKGRLLRTLYAVAPSMMGSRATVALQSEDYALRLAALAVLAQEATATHRDLIRAVAVSDVEPQIRESAWNSFFRRSNDTRPSFAPIADDALRNAVHAALDSTNLSDALGASQAIRSLAMTDVLSKTKLLQAAQRFASSAGNEPMDLFIESLQALQVAEAVPFLERLVDSHDNRGTVQKAAAAILALGGAAVDPMRIPKTNRRANLVVPSEAEMQNAGQARVLFTTTRGNFTFRLRPESALSAFDFLALVRSGYYTNLRVHRTEPFSVQQFGDRYTARGVTSSRSNSIEQWSWDSQFFPGEVGIANISTHYGTEGSHAFVSTAANLLFGNTYTHIADVETGLDVASSLEVGDRILSATIL